jgi:hypothetical protein
MKLFDALKISLPLITEKTKHPNYKHVNDLAWKKYRPLYTGEDKKDLLVRFNPRENQAEFDQRDRLTILVTPAVINNIMGPVRKVPKVAPVVNVATFGRDNKKEDDQLAIAASTFYAGKSVDHYFGSILLDQASIDPNAFCLVLFDDFDHRYEKPIPYPTIVSCKDAWNFGYANGNLSWLLVHRPIKYTEKKVVEVPQARKKNVPTGKDDTVEMKDGNAFWMYTDNINTKFEQVDRSKITSTVEGIVITSTGKVVEDFETVTTKVRDKYYYRASSEELYEVSFYQHDSGMVQAFRLGCIPDQTTTGDTMVSFWQAAMPYLMKSVKSGSELDLSATLHAFLQKISQLPDCRGYMDEKGTKFECNQGYEAGGNTKCRACKGSGLDNHTSGQDHIAIALARNPDERVDIKSLVGYVDLPVDVLNWQDTYVDKLVKECYAAVYGSDRFKNVGETTATGDIIDLQGVYDALKPVADWYSRNRVLVYKLITSLQFGKDKLKKLTCQHEFPRNLRFETLGERVGLFIKMREAGASTGDLAEINNAVMDDVYADDQEALLRSRVMSSFDPFLGKTEAAVMQMSALGFATKEDLVLWTNWNYVFTEAVARTKGKQKEGEVIDFWRMDRSEQRKVIDEIVGELMESLNEESEAAMERAQLGMEGDGADPADPSADPASEDNLPDSPGNKATGDAE